MSGYVLMHRDIIGNPQFRGKDDEYAAMWLVLRAAWETTTVRVNREAVTLERGQCAYAISYLAQAWECSKTTAYGRLKHMEASGFITTHSERGHTIITVCKYAEYQASGGAFGARSAVVQAERDSERVPDRAPNAEIGTNQGVDGDCQTTAEREVVVRPERQPNDTRTNKKEGNTGKEDRGSDEPLSPAEPPTLSLVSSEPSAEQQAFDAYNALAERAGLPKAQVLSPTRRASLKRRLQDCGGLSGWVAALDKLAASSHCTGHNDRGWRADLDFLLKAQSFTRLMEGRYDDRKPQPPQLSLIHI